MIDPRRFAVLMVAVFAFVAVSASAQTLAPYKIGMTWPLTGPLASSGLEYMPGAEVAVIHINRAGGINGHPLQLAVEDSQGTPQGGIAAMRKLIQVDGVQAILTIYTNVVTAQIPLADQLHVPFLSPAQTPGLMSRSPYSFAHAETVSATGGIFATYWKRIHAKKIYALNPNNAIGPVYSAAWKAAAASAGAEYAESSFNYGDNDYRGLVARVKDNNPDQIIVSAQGVGSTTPGHHPAAARSRRHRGDQRPRPLHRRAGVACRCRHLHRRPRDGGSADRPGRRETVHR